MRNYSCKLHRGSVVFAVARLIHLYSVEINFLYPVSREVIYNHATERMRSEAPVQVLAAFRNPQGWQQKGGKQPVILLEQKYCSEPEELTTCLSRYSIVEPLWLNVPSCGL